MRTGPAVVLAVVLALPCACSHGAAPPPAGAGIVPHDGSTFEPAAPRALGQPSTPIPVPARTGSFTIALVPPDPGARARSPLRAKVGECVRLIAVPLPGDPNRRLIGRERWSYGGHPALQRRAADAPGYCVVWSAPSAKAGYSVQAGAIVADRAGLFAQGSASARIVVTGDKRSPPKSGKPRAAHARAGKPRTSGSPPPDE